MLIRNQTDKNIQVDKNTGRQEYRQTRIQVDKNTGIQEKVRQEYMLTREYKQARIQVDTNTGKNKYSCRQEDS